MTTIEDDHAEFKNYSHVTTIMPRTMWLVISSCKPDRLTYLWNHGYEPAVADVAVTMSQQHQWTVMIPHLSAPKQL